MTVVSTAEHQITDIESNHKGLRYKTKSICHHLVKYVGLRVIDQTVYGCLFKGN